MKQRLKIAAAAALLLVGLGSAAILHAESEYDFTLVNCTAYSIDEVYIAPSSSTSWGNDVMGEGTLPPKSYVAISFHPAASAARWDMMIKWTPIGGQTYPPEVWKNLDLAKIHQLNLFYRKNRVAGGVGSVSRNLRRCPGCHAVRIRNHRVANGRK